MLRGAERVVAESSDIRNKALHYYPVTRDIDVIPLGVQPNTFPPATRPELGLAEDALVLVTVGRLVRRKNLLELVDIVADVSRRMPCQLLIIGDGPERGALEQKIAREKLGRTVRLLGRVSDQRKFQYLAAADVYASTALHEGFGIVFLEAMECALPVICYDQGGQTDFLRNGATGHLLSLGDREGFTSKLETILRDSKSRENMARHNAEYVKDFYVERCAERYQHLFREIVQARNLP
jgi:glycosyltransferase involved in cell wall biosynthesis